MSTVSGQGTTYNLPNYHGELIEVTPSETPLLSIAGGLSDGGETTDSVAFEWQTTDLRDPAARPRLEGADAPTAEARARTNVENVVQIFQEQVATSYTKQAATGQYATPGAAPFYSASGMPNPVGSEHSFQVMQSLKQIARDINWCFWYGVKVKPTSNSTARETGGLLSAISSNVKENVALTEDADAATDTITPDAAHDLVAGDRVVFTDVGASTTIVPGRAYWVASVSTTVSFKVAATEGGSAITVGTAVVSYYPLHADDTALSTDNVNSLLQLVYENGGITEQETAVLLVAPGMKSRVSAAYGNAYGKFTETSRTVGGLAVDTILTDFGTLGVKIDRMAPADALTVVSAEQLAPVFLNIPGKGVLFEEELAKTGSADKSQLYGEIGLKYGNERSHGTFRGFLPAA